MFSMSNNFSRMSILLNRQAQISGACGHSYGLSASRGWVNAQTNTNRAVASAVWIELRRIHQKIKDLPIIFGQRSFKSCVELKINVTSRLDFHWVAKWWNISHVWYSGKLRHLAQHLDRFQLFLFAFFAVSFVHGPLYHGRDWIREDANAVLVEQVKYLWISASCCLLQGLIVVLLLKIACEVPLVKQTKKQILPCLVFCWQMESNTSLLPRLPPHMHLPG